MDASYSQNHVFKKIIFGSLIKNYYYYKPAVDSGCSQKIKFWKCSLNTMFDENISSLTKSRRISFLLPAEAQ